ncbi:hypothetical protein BVC80_8751g19 [Macleaya cordata]|uniref:Uncharacterized protein n=1 Tax=Macleaya cordata TaxID=56857 RepID=A0A200QKF2_MACCD|nr:hypothetical protein BVC80_8751g19 [Macleaya cordata]
MDSEETTNGSHGLPMERPSASFASNKSTKMPNIVTPVLIPKEFVLCAESRYLTPRPTSKAMFDRNQVLTMLLSSPVAKLLLLH